MNNCFPLECVKKVLRWCGWCGSPDPNDYVYALDTRQYDIICSYYPNFEGMVFLTICPVDIHLQGQTYTVRTGFATDGVSTGCPCSDLLEIDTAIMHDFLYATHPASKSICDDVLMPVYRRWAVEAFGEAAWVAGGQRGALQISRDSDNNTLMCIYHDATYSQPPTKIILSSMESRAFDDYFTQIPVPV